MGTFLFTSESVACGHPDKVADQISDAILDACLKQDPNARVACETLIARGLVFLAGEISTTAQVNYQEVARKTIKEIGYDDCSLGFDYRSCGILVTIDKQSSDISQGVTKGKGLHKEQGAGDQGIMFGYACNETKELMPLPITLSHEIVRELKRLRENGELYYLGPDAKAQVTVEYQNDYTPLRIDTIVISTQHNAKATIETITTDMKQMIRTLVPEKYLDDRTKYYINATGRFVIGGPAADCGLTGRKTIVDTYGGMAHHGGGAFSGKDPTKVDRSGAYAARYVAKNIVAAGLAKRCEIQISYAIGIAEPISIKIDTFGTSLIDEGVLEKEIPKLFDLTPEGIINTLNLKRPIYTKTAFGGHFGRNTPEFTWESTNFSKLLKSQLT